MSTAGAAELAGHVVLVTGASRGIGRAVARACAHAGATVLAAGRDVRALEALADELLASGCEEPVLVPINLEAAGVDDYALVVEHLEQRFGRLDGLVFAAGMLGDLTAIARYDPVTWARVFQVNLHSALLLAQACEPLLRRSGRGAVVVTLAEEAYAPKANWGAYAVSKYALRGLFEVWARECEGDAALRVNAVVPQPVGTRLRMNAFPGLEAADLPPPESVAEVYVELLGARSAGVNGRVVHSPQSA